MRSFFLERPGKVWVYKEAAAADGDGSHKSTGRWDGRKPLCTLNQIEKRNF